MEPARPTTPSLPRFPHLRSFLGPMPGTALPCQHPLLQLKQDVEKVRLTSSLAQVSPDHLYEHPARRAVPVRGADLLNRGLRPSQWFLSNTLTLTLSCFSTVVCTLNRRSLFDRDPESPHEIGEIPEVVNRIEPGAEHFFHVKQVMQVGSRIARADWTATGRINRSLVANILGLFDQDSAEAGKEPAGPAVA